MWKSCLKFCPTKNCYWHNKDFYQRFPFCPLNNLIGWFAFIENTECHYNSYIELKFSVGTTIRASLLLVEGLMNRTSRHVTLWHHVFPVTSTTTEVVDGTTSGTTSTSSNTQTQDILCINGFLKSVTWFNYCNWVNLKMTTCSLELKFLSCYK